MERKGGGRIFDQQKKGRIFFRTPRRKKRVSTYSHTHLDFPPPKNPKNAFFYLQSLDRCTSVDVENLILEFDAHAQNDSYDFECAEKRLMLQERKKK